MATVGCFPMKLLVLVLVNSIRSNRFGPMTEKLGREISDIRKHFLPTAPLGIPEMPLGRCLSLRIAGCCHKMAKGRKVEPWNWHFLTHYL